MNENDTQVKPREPGKLSDLPLAPKANHYGASLVIPTQAGLMWAVSTQRFWRRVGKSVYVSFEGIGGGVEKGESFLEAAIREGEEETGLRPEVKVPSKTFFVDGIRDVVTTVRVKDEARPLFIFLQKVRRKETLVVYSYLAHLSWTPTPSAEVPALLFMPIEHLFTRRNATLTQLLRGGCTVKERIHVPRRAYIRPWGTSYHFARLVRGGYLPTNPECW
jgi:8-oxo-dGTP pyrophosphatase MutT (NUDIX family)